MSSVRFWMRSVLLPLAAVEPCFDCSMAPAAVLRSTNKNRMARAVGPISGICTPRAERAVRSVAPVRLWWNPYLRNSAPRGD